MRTTLRALLAAIALLVGPIWIADAADLGGAARAQAPTNDGPSQSMGCQVGGQLGYGMMSTDVSTAIGPVAADVNGIASHSTSPDAGIRLGCDVFHVGGSPLTIGAFAEYNWTNTEFSASLTGLGGGVGLKSTMDDNYSIGGRVGVTVGKTLPYLLIAYTHGDMSWSTNPAIPAAAGVSLPNGFNGVTYGGGIEIPLPLKHWSMALETRYTAYDSETITTLAGKGPSINLRPDELSAMARINFNFSGPDDFVKAVTPATYQPMK